MCSKHRNFNLNSRVSVLNTVPNAEFRMPLLLGFKSQQFGQVWTWKRWLVLSEALRDPVVSYCRRGRTATARGDPRSGRRHRVHRLASEGVHTPRPQPVLNHSTVVHHPTAVQNQTGGGFDDDIKIYVFATLAACMAWSYCSSSRPSYALDADNGGFAPSENQQSVAEP